MKKPLIGKFTFAGDLIVNGEKITGVTLEMDRSALHAAEALPLYRECAVIPVDEWEKPAPSAEIPTAATPCPILTDEVIAAHRLPIPLKAMSAICSAAPADSLCTQRGQWLVILRKP